MLTRKRWVPPVYTGDQSKDFDNLSRSISEYFLSLEGKGSLAIEVDEITATDLTVTNINGNTVIVPYYAICRMASDQASITTEAKVTPLTTTLSGFTVASDILTCSNAGKYKLEFSTNYLVDSAGVQTIGYRINGGTTVFPVQQYVATVNSRDTTHTTVYISLAASDTVEFRAATSAGNLTLKAGTGFTLIQVA